MGLITAAIWIGVALLIVAAIVIFSIIVIRGHTEKCLNACKDLQKEFGEAAKDVEKMLSLQLKMSRNYHEDVLFRANLSFISALVLAGIGILLFFSVIIFMVLGLSTNITTTVVSVIAGALVEVLSAINFGLYDRASKQFQTFHKSLDRLPNYMLANSICQRLKDPTDQARTCSQLSLIIASSSVSENEERVIGEIIKQPAVLLTEKQMLTHNGQSTPAQSGEL